MWNYSKSSQSVKSFNQKQSFWPHISLQSVTALLHLSPEMEIEWLIILVAWSSFFCLEAWSLETGSWLGQDCRLLLQVRTLDSVRTLALDLVRTPTLELVRAVDFCFRSGLWLLTRVLVWVPLWSWSLEACSLEACSLLSSGLGESPGAALGQGPDESDWFWEQTWVFIPLELPSSLAFPRIPS